MSQCSCSRDLAGERGAHVHDRRQFVELDIDRGRKVFRLGAVRCDADRDRLADMTHLVGRQHRLRGWLEPRQTRHRDDRLHAHEILRHEHRCLRAGGLADAANARMRDRAAHEGEIAHAGQPDVGDEFALAAQVAVILQSRHRTADTLAARGSLHSAPFPLAPIRARRQHTDGKDTPTTCERRTRWTAGSICCCVVDG